MKTINLPCWTHKKSPPRRLRGQKGEKMKIRIIYEDETTEIREVIKHSIPETTLKAAKDTGKRVHDIAFIKE